MIVAISRNNILEQYRAIRIKIKSLVIKVVKRNEDFLDQNFININTDVN